MSRTAPPANATADWSKKITEKEAWYCGGSLTTRWQAAAAASSPLRPAYADSDLQPDTEQPRIPANPDPVVRQARRGFFVESAHVLCHNTRNIREEHCLCSSAGYDPAGGEGFFTRKGVDLHGHRIRRQ